MRLVDYHVHSDFSLDASSSIDEIAKKAKELGLREICFTQHVETCNTGKDSIAMPAEMIPEYIKQVEDARDKYGLTIKLGLEMEYDDKYIAENRKIIQNYPFDFILGSVHCIDRTPIDFERHIDYFKKYNKEEILERYFSKLHNLIKNELCDVISHPDIFRKHWSAMFGKLLFEDYKEYAADTIKLLKKHDMGFEINSSGCLAIGEQYPVNEFIEMAYDQGIKKITIGSDAHSEKMLSKNLDYVIKLLKRIGYTEVAVFDKHKASYISISELEE